MKKETLIHKIELYIEHCNRLTYSEEGEAVDFEFHTDWFSPLSEAVKQSQFKRCDYCSITSFT